MSTHTHAAEQPSVLERVVFGLMVMALGLLLLLDRLEVITFELSTRLWPWVPILASVARMISPGHHADGRPRKRAPGVWLLFVGVWGLINEYRVYGLYYPTSWPLLMVGGGLMLVWGAFDTRSGCMRAANRGSGR
jgi:hypothetical protein